MNQDCGVALCRTRSSIEQREQSLRVSDDILEPIFPIEARPEAAHFGNKPEMLQHAAYNQAQLIVIDWLREIVVRARAHGLNCVLNRGKGGYDDDRHLRVIRSNPIQQFQAGKAWHLQIRQDKRRRLFFDCRERLLSVNGSGHRVAHFVKLSLEYPAKIFVVIHHENPRWIHASPCFTGRITENIIPEPEFYCASNVPPICMTIW